MHRRTWILSFLLPGFLPGSLHAESVDELIQRGEALEKEDKVQESLDCYLAAEKISPADATIMVLIAMQYSFLMTDSSDLAEKERLGKLSLSYAQKAVKLNPDLCDAQLSIAVSYGKLLPLMSMKDRITTSRTIKSAADRAVVLDPNNDLAWHILARWHQLLSNISGFKRAIAELVYGSLPKASSEDAVKYFEKAIALNPGRLMHYIELGRTYAQMGDISKAQQFIKKGLAMPDREKDDPDTKKRGRETLEKLSS
jgi:tetratricopeptide (TPR) repeat protein